MFEDVKEENYILNVTTVHNGKLFVAGTYISKENYEELVAAGYQDRLALRGAATFLTMDEKTLKEQMAQIEAELAKRQAQRVVGSSNEDIAVQNKNQEVSVESVEETASVKKDKNKK